MPQQSPGGNPGEGGTASHTARSVAAHRLEYDRVRGGYGDPAADEALTGDVADGLTSRPATGCTSTSGRRTAFFDRVVVNAIDRGIAQVVIGGAGYDGRAFRYAKPGVRWFEVDHPATQADKLERIARLGLATPHIRFIPADFTADPVAEPLPGGRPRPRPARRCSCSRGSPSTWSGRTIERVLAEFREVTRRQPPGDQRFHWRPRPRRRAPASSSAWPSWESPVRTVLTFDQAAGLLSAVGWKVREPSDRQRSAGLLLAHATTAVDHSERQRLTPPPSVPPVAWQASAGPPAGRAAARRRPGRRRRRGHASLVAGRAPAVRAAFAGARRVHGRGRQRDRAPPAAPHPGLRPRA